MGHSTCNSVVTFSVSGGNFLRIDSHLMGGRLLPVRMNRAKLVEDKEKITEARAGTIPK